MTAEGIGISTLLEALVEASTSLAIILEAFRRLAEATQWVSFGRVTIGFGVRLLDMCVSRLIGAESFDLGRGLVGSTRNRS